MNLPPKDCIRVPCEALQAFLVYHVTPFEFVHDLQYLLHVAVGLDPSLDAWAEAALVLTPYAIKFRYPAAGDPTRQQARSAVQWAEQVVEAIRARLAEPDP